MIILPLIAIGYTIYYLLKKDDLPYLLIIRISFAIAGGLTNIYDRLIYGSVTDILYFDF